jgi:hypothetical protein
LVFVFLAGFVLCFWAVGCSSKPPDFDRLRADLEKRLADDRGNTSKGNADIYEIVSLAVINQTAQGEDRFVFEIKGEVACLKGFYTSKDGEYSLSKPTWKAKRHLTLGSRIGFAGTVDYEMNGGKWNMVHFSVTMEQRYAPPL